MSFFKLNGYYDKDVKNSSTGRYIFDATKSNQHGTSIPEIGSTLYNTVQTDDDALFINLFGTIRSERQNDWRIYSAQDRERGRSCAKIIDISESESGKAAFAKTKEEGKKGAAQMDDDDYEHEKHPLAGLESDGRLQPSCAYNRGSGGYYRDRFQRITNIPGRQRSKSEVPFARLKNKTMPYLKPLYDGTDPAPIPSCNRTIRIREADRIPCRLRRRASSIPLIDRSRLGKPRIEEILNFGHRLADEMSANRTTQEIPKCSLQLPIMVLTRQRVRVAVTVRETWLLSEIYIYSMVPGQHFLIEDLEKMFKGVLVLNRRNIETENNGRPMDLKHEIYVQNDMIKIIRSVAFRDMYHSEHSSTNERRIYNDLCPAEMTNAAQREIYGNRAMEPNSTLNVISAYSIRRFEGGNIRTNEHLVLTLSHTEEPQAKGFLKWRLEETSRTPEDYKAPVEYYEYVLAGPRCIEIKREVALNPPAGLNALMHAGQPRTVEYIEVRTYGPYADPTSPEGMHKPEQSKQSPWKEQLFPASMEGLFRNSMAPFIPPSSSSHAISDGSTAKDSEVATSKSAVSHASPSLKDEQNIQTKTNASQQASFPLKPHPQSSQMAEKQQHEEIKNIPVQKEDAKKDRIPVQIIQEITASGKPVIRNIAFPPIQTSQPQKFEESTTIGALEEMRSETVLTDRSQKSSRWSRFKVRPSSSQDSERFAVPASPTSADFKPKDTSTPIEKHPQIVKDGNDVGRLYSKEHWKTLKSCSAGTGTHIRSTLDCDITLSTTKHVALTSIPIEIEGFLNGFPWRTTIRLRIKHDANEKPTFIPKRLSVNHMLIWQSEETKK